MFLLWDLAYSLCCWWHAFKNIDKLKLFLHFWRWKLDFLCFMCFSLCFWHISFKMADETQLKKRFYFSFSRAAQRPPHHKHLQNRFQKRVFCHFWRPEYYWEKENQIIFSRGRRHKKPSLRKTTKISKHLRTLKVLLVIWNQEFMGSS